MVKSHYHTHQKALIGIEIVNNTAETKDLKFLGVEHRHHNDRRSGVTLKNIFGDTLFDDNDLTMLKDWIMSVGSIMVMEMGFNTSLLYDGFKGKKFGIQQRRNYGGSNNVDFTLSSYFNHQGINPTVVNIPAVFVLDFFTQLSLTSIQAGERMVLVFVLNPRNADSMEAVVRTMDKLYSKERKRKILLITR